MSHTVTVTRTTTTSTSAIIVNTGYLKTWPGILKLLQLILGIVNVGLIAYYFKRISSWDPAIFFFLIATTFMIGTFLILLSCVMTLSTSSIISKTIYEIVYHGFAAVLYLAAGLTLVIEVSGRKRMYEYEPLLAAGVIGLVCSLLYFLSTFFARKSYYGI